MNRTTATTTGALLLTLIVSGVPALASSGGQNGRDRRQERTTRAQSDNGRSSRSTDTNAARDSGRQTRDSAGRQAPREVAVPRPAPRTESSARTSDRQVASRPSMAPQNDRRQNAAPQNDRRQSAAPQFDSRRNDTRGAYDNRGYSSRGYDNRGYSGRGYDSRAYAYGSYGGYGYRPYISRSRVRFGLGISIFAGRSYGFRFDYGWRAPYAYRFPLRSGIGYGGMSFLIDPDDAAVYVDGEFIGIARDFDGQPIPLAAGVHEIELQALGCEPVVFDVSVRPGQVIPYRGSLLPIR